MLFTPKREIDRRIENLRPLMEKASLDGAFFHYKIDYYYLSGTMQDAFLLVPLDAEPILFVHRELKRARRETPLAQLVPVNSFSDVKPYVRGLRRIGFQLDVAPYNFVMKFKEILGMELERLPSPRSRKIKSPFELSIMERAARIAKKVYDKVPELLREGMKEIELVACSRLAKALGHGACCTRSMNYEAYTWHILSGKTGAIVSQSDSPMGGLGLSPAFPVGASMKRMRRGEPILVDFGICYHGYQVDQTRMYALGFMPDEYIKAYEACRGIHYKVLDGADRCEERGSSSIRSSWRMMQATVITFSDTASTKSLSLHTA
jgi:Xaa-Pro aminopeptidase